ncbi:hypothetical protein ACFQ2A_00930 [Variovorax dokdonensis]
MLFASAPTISRSRPASRNRAPWRSGGHARSAGARSLLAALAFAVWFAAMLGMVHRTLHVPEAHYVAEPAYVTAKAQGPSKQSSRHAFGLFALFGHHTVSDCNLYDQFTGWHAPMSVPQVLLPIVLPAATFVWLEGEAVARWVALFDARGPPSAR